MLSVKECREILGKKYENYTDQELSKILNWLYQLSEFETGEITKNQNHPIHSNKRKAK